MDRRLFLKNYFFSFLFLSDFLSQAKGQDQEILELLGILEPALCGEVFCLRNEPYEAYLDMSSDALKDGIKIWVSSGYRSFFAQRGIWNSKFMQDRKLDKSLSTHEILDRITKYSAIPGTSRHHWGTEIDLVDSYGYHSENPLSELSFSKKGEYNYLNYWLDKYAHKYGYLQTYTDAVERTGFGYEPWHYSFSALSKGYLSQFLKIDLAQIELLKTVKGAEVMDDQFFEKYKNTFLLGINPLLK